MWTIDEREVDGDSCSSVVHLCPFVFEDRMRNISLSF